jgi:hypothetical protein
MYIENNHKDILDLLDLFLLFPPPFHFRPRTNGCPCSQKNVGIPINFRPHRLFFYRVVYFVFFKEKISLTFLILLLDL